MKIVAWTGSGLLWMFWPVGSSSVPSPPLYNDGKRVDKGLSGPCVVFCIVFWGAFCMAGRVLGVGSGRGC